MTIFEKIITRQLPSTIVFEDPEFIAFKDINPKAPVHVLVVPKRTSARLDDITDALELGKLIQTAVYVAKESLGLSDYRLTINVGAGAGQVVFHTHVHILAGWANRSAEAHHVEMGIQ